MKIRRVNAIDILLCWRETTKKANRLRVLRTLMMRFYAKKAVTQGVGVCMTLERNVFLLSRA